MSDKTYIDITPTWEALLPSLVHIAVNGTTAESRKMGMEQLLILARHADRTISDKNTEIKEYDEKGNEIHYRNSTGFEWWMEYDEKGNEIHTRNSNGYEWWWEYDENNNLIHHRNSKGFESWTEYDEKGNEIHYRNNDGIEEKY